MEEENLKNIDVIVIGGGHAGCEAAAAAARMGVKTLLITQDPEKIGEMSCNPAIGGIGKGHLVREVDALDGLMGRVADDAGIQFRLLNRSRGAAVRGPRCQADRKLYRKSMQKHINNQKGLGVLGGTVGCFLKNEDGSIKGVKLETGESIISKAVILTTGTFLNGMIHMGEKTISAGRVDEPPSISLANDLRSFNLKMGRLKTGTPPRLDKNTIIVIWGDHGWHLGDHSLWNKHSNFEQATRSPLIIYDPRINKGYKINTPTEFVDLFPTLSDLANLNIPKNLDGLSLKGQLNGEVTTKKIYAVSQFPRGNKMGYSFRTNDYRYTVWIKNKKSFEPIFKEDIHAEELYDYNKDPLETENKISTESYQKVKATFQLLAARYFNDHVVKSTTDTKKVDVIKYQNTNKRAQRISEFITREMKLTDERSQLLLETLSEKYSDNTSKIKGKNLSQEEKRKIYKATFLKTKNKLLTKFSKSEFAQINKLEKNKNSSTLLIGATLNHNELNTIKQKLFLKDFNYLTPANAAKQSRVHPNPNAIPTTKENQILLFFFV